MKVYDNISKCESVWQYYWIWKCMALLLNMKVFDNITKYESSGQYY